MQLKLLDLQAADTAFDGATNHLAKLPERVHAIEKLREVERLRGEVATAVVEVADIDLEVRKSEADVDLVRQRAAKNASLLDSGSIADAKQLSDLQHEIATLGRRQAELEEVELEIMERLETANARVAELKGELTEAEKVAAEAVQISEALIVDLEAQQAKWKTQRTEIAAEMPADLMKIYEKVRTDNGGIGAGLLQHGKCGACRLQLTPVALTAARTAASNELIRCDECRAILVRTAESGL